jgi:2-C-methyl-D-erythritol 4-phosphate cytidylyltransferase
MQKYTIIVAGGSGSRMKSTLPKQFIELCGKPILMHTIETFYLFDPSMQLIVVLPPEQFEFWQELCHLHQFTIGHQIVAGGQTRFHSVKNGLSAITGDALVAIHDGVRPLVSHDTIARCFEAAALYGNAIPCIAVHETVREVSETENQMTDRSRLRLIQTPQVFKSSLIVEAFNQTYNPAFTDDASVLESKGGKIILVNGNRENIKVTERFDLIVAEAVMRKTVQ